MADADDMVIEALLDDVIDPAIVNDAVEAAVTLLRQPEPIDRVAAVEAEIAGLERECHRLTTAIATGGPLDELVAALQTRDARRRSLQADREAIRARRRLQTAEIGHVRTDLITLARE